MERVLITSKSFELFSIERGNDKTQTRRDFEFHSRMIDLNKMRVIRQIFFSIFKSASKHVAIVTVVWLAIDVVALQTEKTATCNGFIFIEEALERSLMQPEMSKIRAIRLFETITRYVLAL